MHLHLFFYIFLFVSPWAYANERQCLIGNSKSLNLINQIQKEKKTSLFLKQFINEREPQLCLTDTGLSAISQLRKLASDTSAKARPPGIKLECIKPPSGPEYQKYRLAQGRLTRLTRAGAFANQIVPYQHGKRLNPASMKKLLNLYSGQ